MGNAWTADYLKITGELDVDLRSNIAAEARAKIVYERLINFCDDAGTKDALQFLMTREITHMKAFCGRARQHGTSRASRSARSPHSQVWSTSSSTTRPAREIAAKSMRAAPGTREKTGSSSRAPLSTDMAMDQGQAQTCRRRLPKPTIQTPCASLDRSSPRSFARREANRESTSQNGQGCQIGAARHVVQPASPRN